VVIPPLTMSKRHK